MSKVQWVRELKKARSSEQGMERCESLLYAFLLEVWRYKRVWPRVVLGFEAEMYRTRPTKFTTCWDSAWNRQPEIRLE